MNKKDSTKLNIISAIDDEIIEKQSIKRFDLLTGAIKPQKNRNKMVAFISVAACFCLIIGSLFALWFGKGSIASSGDKKQVPVYQGMTVSNSAPSMDEMLVFDAVQTIAFNPTNIDFQTLDADDSTPQINVPTLEGKNRALYYAKPNEDIYITIHINNPDQFEILSFTLNGVKYQSYMFEQGSNSENLILKVNVGDVSGMVEYTIDAIKYVDGEMIKDVRMEGDKTVIVGVYSNEQPTFAISNEIISYFEMKFDVSLSDTLSLINDCSGSASAFIYENETLVSEKKIDLANSSSISFGDLVPGKTYKRLIVAYYDALDGNGFSAHIMSEKEFVAKNFITVSDIAVNKSTVSFNITNSDESLATVNKIELIDPNGNVIESTNDTTARKFELIYAGTYLVKVTFTYEYNGAEVVGYAYSDPSAPVSVLASVDSIVHGGTITKKYYPDMHVENITTEDYRTHLGIDITPSGDDLDVYAITSGTVSAFFYEEDLHGDGFGFGWSLYIISSDGKTEFRYRSVSQTPYVQVGDTIVAGQKIATVSDSATLESAEGPHLHLEIFVDGESIDPFTFIEKNQ